MYSVYTVCMSQENVRRIVHESSGTGVEGRLQGGQKKEDERMNTYYSTP